MRFEALVFLDQSWTLRLGQTHRLNRAPSRRQPDDNVFCLMRFRASIAIHQGNSRRYSDFLRPRKTDAQQHRADP